MIKRFLMILSGLVLSGLLGSVQAQQPVHMQDAFQSVPHIKQVAGVVNPATNKIHLFGVTDSGHILQFEQRTGQWIGLDSAVGFLDSTAAVLDSPTASLSDTLSPHFRQVEAIVNPDTGKIRVFGTTSSGKVLKYDARTRQWTGLDQADAGFLD